MKYSFLLFFPALLLFSCDSSDQLENRSTTPTEADSVLVPGFGPDEDSLASRPRYVSSIIKAFSDFQQAVYNEDTEGVNAFIDPEYGVFIIENPGAMPKMTRVTDISTFKRQFQELSFFSVKERLKTCKPVEEDLPTFNCEDQTNKNAGYSKEGCFIDDAKMFRESTIYKFAGLTEEETELVEDMLPLVQKIILQTTSSYKFYFGIVNGKWRVLFIDLRTPCTA
ncbi:MAG TPA: hypothetical protein VK927_06545 [Adhaeribacter sp.]|nr:hypothetical protein [Adhaeribacter sp.]